jgi:hypothetical protein
MAMSIFSAQINGLSLTTGDLICTSDGGGELIRGEFWRVVGKLIPGEVDHIVVFLGPDGRCVEAGAKGKVILFQIPGPTWKADRMLPQRGLIDQLYGTAYPLAERSLSQEAEEAYRRRVAKYCLDQVGKPYNLNFLNSGTDKAFYCSQLAYKAYLQVGIDLNTNLGIPSIPFTDSIIFPQEIYSSCVHQRPADS